MGGIPDNLLTVLLIAVNNCTFGLVFDLIGSYTTTCIGAILSIEVLKQKYFFYYSYYYKSTR